MKTLSGAARVLLAATLLALMLIMALSVLLDGGLPVAAQASTRQMKVVSPYTEHEWWLIYWADNLIVCQVLVDHEGVPTLDEVANKCGAALANEWWVTPPCNLAKHPDRGCAGLYIYYVQATPKEREVLVDLPMASATISLEGCNPVPPENLCPTIPTLVLTGVEPLPDYQITSIQGTIDGAPFACPGDICRLQLFTTSMQGITVEFQAISSYGDSSPLYTAAVRVVDTGVSAAPGASGYYVDVISSQWSGPSLTSCAKIWEAFPPVGGTPAWLTTPDHFEMMASGEPYYYLAGRLIFQGVVDASTCPNNGLLPNGYADACGLETARPLVEDWQNQFDQRIIKTANDTGVPAQLMKNLFAQESQFWPGMYRVEYELGLGQMTSHGVDPVFIWNPDFYHQFCPLILSGEACARGYMMLSESDRAMLRGALALQARADCPDCPTGIDLTNVNFSVSLFANTLQANCAQVSRAIYNASGEMAGRVASYEDLWRFTIANYHAGPGCVSYAIYQSWQNGGALTWSDVSTRFTPACQGVVPYVDKITAGP